MTFYAKDRLQFEKMPGGEVRVIIGSSVQDPNAVAPETSVIVDPDTWASAVAAMSAEGDTAQGFEIARGFHLQGLKRVRYEPPTAI